MSGERYVFVMTLVAGQEAEYQRRHDEIWPDMVEALHRSGYTDYTLHRDGRTIVGVAQMVPDIATATARMAAESVTARWNDSFAGIIETNVSGGYGADATEIWRLQNPEGGQ